MRLLASCVLTSVLFLLLSAPAKAALSDLPQGIGVTTSLPALDRVTTLLPGETTLVHIITDDLNLAGDGMLTAQFSVQVDPRLEVVNRFASTGSFFVANPTPDEWQIGFLQCQGSFEGPHVLATYVVKLPLAEPSTADLRIDVGNLDSIAEPAAFGPCSFSSRLLRLYDAGGAVINPSAASIVHLSASPEVLVEGRPLELAWETFGADTIALNGVPVASAGSMFVTPTVTTDYQISSSVGGGTPVELARQVLVIQQPRVDSFTAEIFETGGQTKVRLRWDSRGANLIEIDGTTGFLNNFGTAVADLVPSAVYELRATNEWGTTTVLTSVEGVDGPPIITQFTANPAMFNWGSQVTLNYGLFNADSASIDNGVGSVDPAGGSVLVGPTGSTSYTLTATNSEGSVTETRAVQLAPPAVVIFEAVPAEIAGGAPTQLRWDVTSGETIEILPDVGLVSSSGIVTVTPPADGTVYTITATNPEGTDSATTTVTWKLPSVSISSSTVTPFGGEDFTLTVGIADALSATLEPGFGSIDPINGTFVTNVAVPTTFTVAATNLAGSVSATVTITPLVPTVELSADELEPFATDTVTLTATIAGALSADISPDVGSIDPSGGQFGVQVPTQTTYTLSATNTTGTSTAAVVVSPKAPTATLVSTIANPFPGQAFDLVATVQGAESVTLEPGFGSIDVGGGTFTTSIVQETTFVLTATSTAGVTMAQVVVAPRPPTIASFQADPSAFVLGETTTLSWNVQAADTITIEPLGFTTSDPVGTFEDTPVTTTQYVLTATNSGGSATANQVVSVVPIRIQRFTASPTLVVSGGQVELSWEVIGAGDIELVGFGPQPAVGTLVDIPSFSRTYRLRVSNGAFVETRDVSVSVVLPDAAAVALSWSPTDPQGPPPAGGLGATFNFYALLANMDLPVDGYEFALDIPPCLLVLDTQFITPGASPVGVGQGSDNWIVGLGFCVFLDVIPLLQYTAVYFDPACRNESVSIMESTPASLSPPVPAYLDCAGDIRPLLVGGPLRLDDLESPVSAVSVGLSASETTAGIELRWDINGDVPVNSLEIQRSEGNASMSTVAQFSGLNVPETWEDQHVEAGTTYRYRTVVYAADLVVTSPEVEAKRSLTPNNRTRLLANLPNPFNPSTELRFVLASAGEAELTIFDVAGREVRRFVRPGLSAGPHSLVWNGQDERGRTVASGVYIVKFRSGATQDSGRITLLK